MIYSEIIQCPHCNHTIDIKKVRETKIAKEVINRTPRLGMVYINWIVAQLMGQYPIIVRYSKKRDREIVVCRQVSQYFCRKEGYSYYKIRDFFNYKQHATIISNCKRLENDLLTDKKLKELIIEIEEKLKIK